MAADSWYRWEGQSLILNLRIQPRASRDGFAEQLGSQRKLRITAPPVDGKANNHLIGYLARLFGVAKSAIKILSGETGRNKLVRIQSPGKLPEGIQPAANSPP